MKRRHAVLVALAVLFSVYPIAYAASPVRYRYTLTYGFENRGTESLELYQEDIAIPFFMRLDREFVIRRAWEEATGSVRRVELH